jgi:hypothetical protein
MTTPKDKFVGLHNKLSLIQSRLTYLFKVRDKVEGDLQRKGLKPEMRGILEARLASTNDLIKAAQMEEAETDDERYDALHYPKR